jgi:pyruvate,water dikinase
MSDWAIRSATAPKPASEIEPATASEWAGIVPLHVLARRRGGDDPRIVGGKAAGLVRLVQSGFDVPEAYVLPAEAFVRILASLPPSCDPRALLRSSSARDGAARAAEARQRILAATLPSELDCDLRALWERVHSRCPWGLAVRSSATCEDGALVAMAGLAETVLGVRGHEGLSSALKQVWASAANGRALAYLSARGVRELAMAVVFQRVVEATAAGVMYTRAPDALRGRSRPERVVNAAFGLGGSVVDGAATPDVVRFDSDGNFIDANIAAKTHAIVVGVHGTETVTVADPYRPALTREQVRNLAEVAARLERIDPVSWDVEFACDADRTWVVQARAVTGRGFPDGGDEDTVWSSVNVGEALPGVATPLTWSVASDFSEAGFRRAFSALGCRVPRRVRLIGNIHGRFYLNLSRFMRIAAQVPLLDPRTLVELGGGGGADRLGEQVHGVSRRRFYLQLPITAARIVSEQLRLDADVRVFEASAESAVRAARALDLPVLPDDAIARHIRDVLGLLKRTGSMMLTCASSALGYHVALKALLQRVAPLDAERLVQSLTSGIRDVESARPGIAVMHIASLARREPHARAALELESTVSMKSIPESATREALEQFLVLYGDRAVREAELSTPRWMEDPRPVLRMVRAALRTDGMRSGSAAERANATSDAEWAWLEPRLSPIERTVLRHLVVRAQRSARLRERMRCWVTRVLGMIRAAVLDADRRLLRRDSELAADWRAPDGMPREVAPVPAVFFLTVDEVVGALISGRADLAPLVRSRRAEFARDRARPDPPATFVGSPPPVVLPPVGGDVLRGLPASSGVVKGRVRVLLREDEIDELEPGEILVVHTSDVGWTPLFLVAAGVVTALGGPLSHAAVVAREFGIPSVVNVPDVTRVLRTGDTVRVNGDRGTVERMHV